MSCSSALFGLCVYISTTLLLSPRPRTLFVSPRCPSRSLRTLCLSFCIVLFCSPCLPPLPLLFLLPCLSQLQVLLLLLLLRLVLHYALIVSGLWLPRLPLLVMSVSALLEAATWRSSTVFTSFYLRDVQFESAQGFSLGPVVAAGAVI